MKGVREFALLVLAVPSISFAQTCGTVTLAEMNWNSASLLANIDSFILKHGYDCNTVLVPGDSTPTSISMIEKGQPDIASELWTNNLKDALEKGVEEKRLRYAGKPLTEGGREGFWVPRYMVDKYPELATIEGVRKHAHLFTHPEKDNRSAFYGCPSGWTCQLTASRIFNALELEKQGFDIIDPGSSAGLAGSLAKAYERKEPWFGYYWSPTSVLGKYDMVMVDFGVGVKYDEFMNCVSQPVCDKPVVTMYPSSPVHTITTERFAKTSPTAYQYINQRTMSSEQMNKLLAWMEDNSATGEDAMYYFLENQSSTWHKWVSAETAKKIERAL